MGGEGVISFWLSLSLSLSVTSFEVKSKSTKCSFLMVYERRWQTLNEKQSGISLLWHSREHLLKGKAWKFVCICNQGAYVLRHLLDKD